MSLRNILPFLPPLAFGTILRTYGLGHQILLGDELHAVRSVSALPLGALLTTYQERDPSLPLAGLYSLVSSWAPLSEWGLRAPILLSGLLMIIVAPWCLYRRIGRPAALVLSWLIAISPALVMYSRIARPYLPIVLLSLLAIDAFWRWCEKPKLSAALGYAGCASLAIYLHLVAAPFVLAPFLFVVVSRLWPRGPGLPTLRDTAGLALLTLAPIAAFLLPASASLQRLVAAKGGRGEIAPTALLEVLELQLGTSVLPIAIVALCLGIGGWIRILRKEPQWGSYVLVVLAMGVAGLFALAPHRFGEPLIFNRYVIIPLPFTLAAIASAVTVSTKPVARWGVPAGLLAVLFLTGPFSDPFYRESSFVHHNDSIRFTRPRATGATADIPRLYHTLASGDETGAIIEAPCDFRWHYTRAYYIYQRFHGRPVRLSCPGFFETVDPARFRLRSLIPARTDALLASGADHLVLHLDYPGEEEGVVPPRRPNRATRELFWQEARTLSRRLRNAWGAPHITEGGIEVWNLDRVRGAAKRP